MVKRIQLESTQNRRGLWSIDLTIMLLCYIDQPVHAPCVASELYIFFNVLRVITRNV